ncbi:MAG: hypothetical protein BWY69_00584 [Planctomycetes bacterium ADurb.Bin401]|nr:MAG: hypothetical protein BWY69_00584 [Planctomycetes bacterium ADurb.Bin401]
MNKWMFIFAFSICAACGLLYAQAQDSNSAPAEDRNALSDINNSHELLIAAEVEGPNIPASYIGGDAFNLRFSNIFKKYVNENGYVNYSKLRRFRGELNIVINDLANIEPEVYITWSRNEKIAFWINAYNICTLKGIVDNYPIAPSRFMLLFYPPDSVMHIRGLRNETFFMIMGIQYTLEEIERDALLGRFDDPRICFAVNYGTISSAALRNEPYIGKVLDQQLDEQVKNYFSRPDGLNIEQAANVVYLSPIFKMYEWHEDAFLKRFGTNKLFRQREPLDRAILNFVSNYVSPSNANYLKTGAYTIEYLKYNWKLNDQQD